jgi:hypothetical protein
MPTQPILSTTKDNPMQIDETRFEHLIEYEKQRWCKNNFFNIVEDQVILLVNV